MRKILFEMPWPIIETNCPECNEFIDQYDYFVELWNIPQDEKTKWLRKLSNLNHKGITPIICPFCEIYFVYDRHNNEKSVKKIPSIFEHNKEIILDELVKKGYY